MIGRLPVVVAVLTAAVSVPAWGQTAAAPANEDCQTCHGDSSTTRASGQPVWVHPDRFAQSVHAPLSCVDCHTDLAASPELPHPEKLKPAECTACHDEAVTQHAKGVHGRPAASGERRAACTDCHGNAHEIRPSSDPASSTHTLNESKTCASCHQKGAAGAFADSIHGQALSRRGLVVAPSCSDCHRAHDTLPNEDAASLVHPTNVAGTCGTCHLGIQQEYSAGIHAAKLGEGAPNAPTCATCHSAHSIQRTDNGTFQLDVIRECGTCHSDKIRTYRDTFHGQVTALGFERVAKCADCHGAHTILPASNPLSMVSDERLVETCGRCHEGANASFVQYDPHPNPDDYGRNRALWWVKRFYVVLITGCFSLFGLHTVLWFWRERREREGRP